MKFARGITMDPATQAEIDYVEENFRDGDRREAEIEGGARTTIDEFEKCWTVRAGADIIGYFGVMTIPSESQMSRTRVLCFMSCRNADRHKIAFVAASRSVLRYVVGECPKWTSRYVSWPLASYDASVRWQRKTLGMREIGRVPVKDDFYVWFEITKEEVLG